MTHAEFAQKVAQAWGIFLGQMTQSRYLQWYHYTTPVDGRPKIIGEYTLRDSRPVFVLTRPDGTEKVWETKEYK